MPRRVAQPSEARLFGGKLLHPILSKQTNAGIVGLCNAFRREVFANRHERDLFGVAPCPMGSGGDLIPQPRDPIGDTHRPTQRRAPGGDIFYTIAVGGAGSLGSAALVSGKKIKRTARIAITPSPARYDGRGKICGGTLGAAQMEARNPANSRPMSASPAIKPEAVSTPAFSTRARCAPLKLRRFTIQSPRLRNMPPTKMANVVSNGRYMPTATSMGLRTCIMISAMPKKMPTTTSGQGMSWPTIPMASAAIRPAWGAGRALLPKPNPRCSRYKGKYMTRLATTTAINSAV